MLVSPAFGQADLSNCERELIHLAGSIQPHGILLAIREADLRIEQASASTGRILGLDAGSLVGQPLAELAADAEGAIGEICARPACPAEPVPLLCRLRAHGKLREFEGALHREPGGLLVLELEPAGPLESLQPGDTLPSGATLQPGPTLPSGATFRPGPTLPSVATFRPGPETVDLPGAQLIALVEDAVKRFSAASTIATLADSAVKSFRDIFGYDRTMVYKFDPDGHGKIIAEARDPRLDSLLGHHYPATDIPQRARELYLRNRLRVLVDVNYEPAQLMPRRASSASGELDMSMCYLRSMSPLHLQYLKNMGVTATLVVSLVREGRLWGLVACHHYTPRNLRFAARSAADLLGEVITTRLAAIENYAHAQVAIQVRRLEQRLVEATSTEGDWRYALFRNPRTLLQPLDATGAALFHDGELLTTGEVPSTAEMRALQEWIDGQQFDGPFSCSSVARANAGLDSLTPTASGVLAVKLFASRPDYLMWFRKEQLLTVTWAGDPSKPAIGNDPMELSPRRSFAAWSEIVRGTALPWSSSDVALARAFGAALIDIIVQVNAVRLLIAEHQIGQIRATVGSSNEPVVIADADGRALFANAAFHALLHPGRAQPASYAIPEDLSQLFSDPVAVRKLLGALGQERRPWRGVLALAQDGGAMLQVSVRAEVVPARDGSVLGFFLIFADLTNSQRAAAARQHLEQSLARAVVDIAAGGDRLRTELPDQSEVRTRIGVSRLNDLRAPDDSRVTNDLPAPDDSRTTSGFGAPANAPGLDGVTGSDSYPSGDQPAGCNDSMPSAMPGDAEHWAARHAGRDDLIGAILANASLAAMDIADGSASSPVAPLLEELEASTRRATTLYGRIRSLTSR